MPRTSSGFGGARRAPERVGPTRGRPGAPLLLLAYGGPPARPRLPRRPGRRRRAPGCVRPRSRSPLRRHGRRRRHRHGVQLQLGGGADAGDAGCPLLDCTCSGSAPAIVAAGSPFADSPRGLTVTADGLFWVDDQGGAVVQAPAGGGAPLRSRTPARPAPSPCPATPSCGSPTAASSPARAPRAARARIRSRAPRRRTACATSPSTGRPVLWSDVGSGVASGKVQACALASCSPVDLLDSLYAPAGVELQGGTAFGVDQGNGHQNGTVTRSPATSQAPSQIAASLNFPTGVAVDDTYAYWDRGRPRWGTSTAAPGRATAPRPRTSRPRPAGSRARATSAWGRAHLLDERRRRLDPSFAPSRAADPQSPRCTSPGEGRSSASRWGRAASSGPRAEAAAR